MGNLVSTPFSEVSATIKFLSDLGVESEDFLNLRQHPDLAKRVVRALKSRISIKQDFGNRCSAKIVSFLDEFPVNYDMSFAGAIKKAGVQTYMDAHYAFCTPVRLGQSLNSGYVVRLKGEFHHNDVLRILDVMGLAPADYQQGLAFLAASSRTGKVPWDELRFPGFCYYDVVSEAYKAFRVRRNSVSGEAHYFEFYYLGSELYPSNMHILAIPS